jgi:sulfoacetaldehyde dehydrogenase
MSDNETMIHDLIEKARAAQRQVADYTQQQVDELCLAVGWEVYKDENIAECARQAVEETGMGRVADKITKHKVKVLGVLKEVQGARTVGRIEHDEASGLSKYAKPVGVVGALTPVTNPTATPASNAVSILKGRNAVIFAPHPRAKKSCEVVCNFMRQGLKKVGAPQDLIQWIAEPSVELSQELMRQVDLVLATGGGAMVKAAYSSGTPAYGVGAGNPVVIVADDADLDDAAAKIKLSKTFDHATSCSSDNSIIIQNDVYDAMVEAFRQQGGYLCSPEQRDKLEAHMWQPNKKTGKVTLNIAVVAQSPQTIAADAGLDIPDDTTMLMVEGENPGEGHWSGEKLSPVMTLWRYADIGEAIDIATTLTHYAGEGHSVGIYTHREDDVDRLALAMKTSRIMVRQAHAPSCGGNFHNAMPSTTTLGCGTWGGNITTENIYWKHFINVTWVSRPFEPQKPTDEEMFGPLWAKIGK